MADKRLSIYDNPTDSIEFLKKIAGELVNENAELKNNLDLKERELDLIYAVIRNVTFSMNWDDIQERVVELVMDFFTVVRFFLIALYGDNNTVYIKMKSSNNDECPISDEIRMPFQVDENTRWDEVVSTEEWSRFFESMSIIKGLQSSFIPLSFQDHELGFLMICKHSNEEYGKSEWRFLCTIANYVGSVIDNSHLFQLARTDPLTGLFTRRFLKQRLSREIEWAARNGSRIAVYMLDIDHFKRVNDTYGHPCGDQVLVSIANRLRKVHTRSEQIYRYGGEEILVCSHESDRAEAVERGELIRSVIADEPFIMRCGEDTVSKTITISAGVAVFPEDAATMEDLIDCADKALYAAKETGRNRVVAYSTDLD